MDAGGRHGATFGRLDSTRTPGLHTGDWHAACFPARGCKQFRLLSGGDNNCFLYKDDAHVEWRTGIEAVMRGAAREDADNVPLFRLRLESR
jgi:hypothetical protein